MSDTDSIDLRLKISELESYIEYLQDIINKQCRIIARVTV